MHTPAYSPLVCPVLRALLLTTTLFTFIPHAHALNWDTVPANGTIFDAGSGTWSFPASNWYGTPTSSIAWTNGSTADFFGTDAAAETYVVTVDANPGAIEVNTSSSAGGLSFHSSGYLLTGTTAATVLNGVRRINVDPGKTATIKNLTISSLTIGAAGGNLGFNGTGTLTLGSGATITGNNSYNFNGTTRFATGSVLTGTGGNTDVYVGTTNGANGTLIADGGTLNYGKQMGVAWVSGSDSATGILTINGGIVAPGSPGFAAGTARIYLGQTGALVTGTATATINLNGGVLVANQISKGVLPTVNADASARINATFNFNGGILRANDAGSSGYRATFLEGLNTANVRAGGAKIDTNGVNITINQALLHSTHVDDAALVTDGGLTKSGTGMLTLGSAGNTYNGGTFVNAGVLATDAHATFGTGDIIVASGAALILGNSTSIADTATLSFDSAAAGIVLSFSSGSEILGGLKSISGSLISDGVYTAAQLNGLFGGSIFSGSGTLTVVNAIPEPATFAVLIGLAAGASVLIRRRRSIMPLR